MLYSNVPPNHLLPLPLPPCPQQLFNTYMYCGWSIPVSLKGLKVSFFALAILDWLIKTENCSLPSKLRELQANRQGGILTIDVSGSFAIDFNRAGISPTSLERTREEWLFALTSLVLRQWKVRSHLGGHWAQVDRMRRHKINSKSVRLKQPAVYLSILFLLLSLRLT